MLVLRRKIGERIRISGGIVLTVNQIEGNRVVIGIEAPKDVGVKRSEPCIVCHRPTFETYLGYGDMPFCGDERCAHRIRMQEKRIQT